MWKVVWSVKNCRCVFLQLMKISSRTVLKHCLERLMDTSLEGNHVVLDCDLFATNNDFNESHSSIPTSLVLNKHLQYKCHNPRNVNSRGAL